jgi:hypothetical protein
MSKAKEDYYNNFVNVTGHTDLECFAYAYIKELELKTQWISVEDRLPDEEVEHLKYYCRTKCYIVSNNKGIVFVAHFKKESYNKTLKNYFRSYCSTRVLKNITHWMPLPEPPEDE